MTNLLAASDDDRPDARVLVHLVERFDQVVHEAGAKRVERLRSMKRDQPYPAFRANRLRFNELPASRKLPAHSLL